VKQGRARRDEDLRAAAILEHGGEKNEPPKMWP